MFNILKVKISTYTVSGLENIFKTRFTQVQLTSLTIALLLTSVPRLLLYCSGGNARQPCFVPVHAQPASAGELTLFGINI